MPGGTISHPEECVSGTPTMGRANTVPSSASLMSKRSLAIVTKVVAVEGERFSVSGSVTEPDTGGSSFSSKSG